MQNFITLVQPLLGEKYVEEKEERKKRKIIPKIVDTTLRLQCPSAAHALRSDQKLLFQIIRYIKVLVILAVLCLSERAWLNPAGCLAAFKSTDIG